MTPLQNLNQTIDTVEGERPLLDALEEMYIQYNLSDLAGEDKLRINISCRYEQIKEIIKRSHKVAQSESTKTRESMPIN